MRMLQNLSQRFDMVGAFNRSLFQTSQLSREVYYLLYADGYEIPSKVADDPEEPSLGRIRADSITPPHSPTSIKRCISRVERNPALLHGNLFADTSCDTPLTEGHISILHTNGPGLSQNEPMAIVQANVQVESPLAVEVTSIPDGKYLIKNRASNFCWFAKHNPTKMVYFYSYRLELAKVLSSFQVNENSLIILLFRG